MTTGRQTLTGILLLSSVILITWLIQFQLPNWVIWSANTSPPSSVSASDPVVIQPEFFSEFWAIWLFYVVSWGMVTSIMVFIVGAFGLTMFSAATKRWSYLGARLIRFASFLGILLPVGGIFNAFWCCLVSGNLYWTQDVDSPEDDFSTFTPIDSGWLTMQHGHLLTVSMPQLQLVWLFFAGTSWAISFVLYHLIKRKILPALLALSRPPLASTLSHA